MRACVRACVRAVSVVYECVRGCVRACVHTASMRVHVLVSVYESKCLWILHMLTQCVDQISFIIRKVERYISVFNTQWD